MKIAFSTIGVIAAIGLILMGLFIDVPSKEISYYSSGDNGYTEYVGGDAYNYIIEASLRGGEIAGAKASKAIYISAGALLFVISGAFLGDALSRLNDDDETDKTAAPKDTFTRS